MSAEERSTYRDKLTALLRDWQTEPYGDVRLNADRIVAKVLAVPNPELDRLSQENDELRRMYDDLCAAMSRTGDRLTESTRRAESAEQEVERLRKLVPLPDAELREKFWSKVRRGDGCWEWQDRVQHNGYGRFYTRDTDTTQQAHRVAWQLVYGRIPDGLFVCHRCDNPPCCNPDHLFLGTKFDNMQDCADKGRNIMQRHPERSTWTRPRRPEQIVRGEQQGNSKLTEAQVREIHAKRASGVSTGLIAEEYGIHDTHVRRIVSGRAWSHVHAALDNPPPGDTPEPETTQ